MLKSLGYIEECLNRLADKRWSAQRTRVFISNLDSLLPEWRDMSLLTLLTTEMQDKLASYVGDVQQRVDSTVQKRKNVFKAVGRKAIEEGFLPNIPVLYDSKGEKEVKMQKSLRYREGVESLLSRFYSKGEAMVGMCNRLKNISRGNADMVEIESLTSQKLVLEKERQYLAIAILSVLVCGVGVETIVRIKHKDLENSVLNLGDGFSVKLPSLITSILYDSSTSRRGYVFSILAAGDSMGRIAEKIEDVKKRIKSLLTRYSLDIPVVEDSFLAWTILAHECSVSSLEIRRMISCYVWKKCDTQTFENAMRKVASEYDNHSRAWYCFVSRLQSRNSVRKMIIGGDRCPADVEFFMPKDMVYRKEGNRMLPMENPFFARMILVNCNYFEAKIIESSLNGYGRLYGFVDSEGRSHCRISEAEKIRLEKYTSLQSKRKMLFEPGTNPTNVKVYIKSGQFRGMTGYISRHDDKTGKSDVVLQLFGAQTALIQGLPDTSLRVEQS